MALRSLVTTATTSYVDLRYLKDLDIYNETKPYYISGVLSEDQEKFRTNLEYELLPGVPVYNLRGEEDKLSLEKHGFQILGIPDSIANLDIRGSSKEVYIREMSERVKVLLNASFVLCYDCRVSPRHQHEYRVFSWY